LDLEALRDDWARLWERCPYATPFQSPEWLIPWWRAFHPGRLSCAVTSAGFAPLYRDEAGVVRLIGAGNTDYLDVLVEPGCGAGWVYTHAGAPAEFQDLRAGSPLLAAAPEHAQISHGELCPVLEVPPGWTPPHGLRRNLRRYRDKLGDVTFETSRDPERLSTLFRLHGERWRRMRGEAGVLAEDALVAFHREVACGFARRGWLRFWSVNAAGRTAAIIYGFACRGRAYCYLGGFEPSLARFGPGTLAIGYAIESARSEGIREIDFLRGAESYKLAWAAQGRVNHRVAVQP
jgi:CelD/BcsL family acetyltransferase involved in cellulose biosynthesis